MADENTEDDMEDVDTLSVLKEQFEKNPPERKNDGIINNRQHD